jgi:hypothetical protein
MGNRLLAVIKDRRWEILSLLRAKTLLILDNFLVLENAAARGYHLQQLIDVTRPKSQSDGPASTVFICECYFPRSVDILAGDRTR